MKDIYILGIIGIILTFILLIPCFFINSIKIIQILLVVFIIVISMLGLSIIIY